VNTAERPVVQLRADELPAYCPNPSMPVWNHHPRVFLEVGADRATLCPYCGTRYRLVAEPSDVGTVGETGSSGG
jgi:uncharacterized Zn-finger protein